MNAQIDPEVKSLAEAQLARAPNSRASKAIRLMLEKGFATTRDLNQLGYDHPPRAIGDVKDVGLPVVMEMIRSADGKRMASYRFGTSTDIRSGQIGRTNFSKAFKDNLIAFYGSRDAITNAEHPARSLQIDHRIPYRVAGDEGIRTSDVKSFMLLSAKSQRAKSWSCEQCENFARLCDPTICSTCFWCSPTEYGHVAMIQERRTEVVWQGDEVADYEWG